MVLSNASPLLAQTGFLDRAITMHGENYRYQVYVPSDYTVQTKWPVIVSLHGNGDQGSDGMYQTNAAFARRIRDNRGPFPAIVVFPQGKARTRWLYLEMQELVLAQLDRTIAELHRDPASVSLN